MKIEYRKLPTEQTNFRSRFLDEISVRQILVIMNRENLEIPKAIRPELGRIENAVQKIVKSLKSGGRLYFTGSGTSGRLGVLESAELPPTFNTPPVLAQAIMAGGKRAVFRSREGAEDDRVAAQSQIRKKVRENDVVIGIAASGVTPFVQGALLEARAKKAGTILITCNPGKELKSLADIVIAPHAGPELIAGSTRLKSGTATKMVLNMLTTASMVQLGKVYQNTMVDLQPKSKKLR
ncbi:MAG: N-acetylmuramic acid 6-phosphate etherase, partial [Elusimicrobia bacterium]|nr:N-acetylmuramic acid 6-phosphate etherase [Elusimicrobiota bacterium]